MQLCSLTYVHPSLPSDCLAFLPSVNICPVILQCWLWNSAHVKVMCPSVLAAPAPPPPLRGECNTVLDQAVGMALSIGPSCATVPFTSMRPMLPAGATTPLMQHTTPCLESCELAAQIHIMYVHISMYEPI